MFRSVARALVLATLLSLACTPALTPAPGPAPAPAPAPAPRSSLANLVVADEESSPPIAKTPEKPVCKPIDVALPDVAHEEGIDVETPDIVDDDEALAPFYAKLAAVMRGTAKDHVRVAMYGDSNMTMDFITGHMRRFWQGKLGDAGHGWISMGRPWSWYHHMDARHGAYLKSWIHFAASTAPAADHLIGFAGIAAQNVFPNAVAYVQTADEGAPIGTKASRFDVYWLARPKAGVFDVVADGQKLAEIDASSDAPHAEFRLFELDDAPHRFSLVAKSTQPVRLFGVTMERAPENGASVIVDSLGCGALSARYMADREDAKLNETMLAHRKYDLVLELVGTNMWEPQLLEDEWTRIVATHRAARPDVAFVMMSPPDHAQSMQSPHSDPRIVKVGEMKREIAAKLKIGFFDFRAAMGGDLSIVRFRRHQMAWVDLIHFTEKGAAYMADRIDLALMRGFSRWLQKHPDAGCL